MAHPEDLMMEIFQAQKEVIEKEREEYITFYVHRSLIFNEGYEQNTCVYSTEDFERALDVFSRAVLIAEDIHKTYCKKSVVWIEARKDNGQTSCIRRKSFGIS